jgi:hypothetical protein
MLCLYIQAFDRGDKSVTQIRMFEERQIALSFRRLPIDISVLDKTPRFGLAIDIALDDMSARSTGGVGVRS